MLKYAAVFLSLALCASVGRADVIVDVGSHDLQPNMPAQVIQILVHGGDQVQGVMVQAQVEDGGKLAGGNITGPTITKLDVITGTIFADHNTLQTPSSTGYMFPQVARAGTTTPAGTTVAAEGVLATLLIDTTDIPAGTYSLNLTGTVNLDTVFGEIVPTIHNGTLNVIPEPATGLLAAAGATLLLRRRRHAAAA
jgi:hypothetical protein